MKLSSSSIGTLLFTAIGTAAFVYMAKRPAVDTTAMQFGMVNSSTQATTSTNTPAEPEEPQQASSDNINTANKEVAESDTTENKDDKTVEEKTAEVAPVPVEPETPAIEQAVTEKAVSEEVITSEQTSNIAAENVAPQKATTMAPAMATMAPTTPSLDTQNTMPTPTKEAVVESVIETKEMPAETTPPVSPSMESSAPVVAIEEQAEKVQAAVSTETTDTPQSTENTNNVIATPAATQAPTMEVPAMETTPSNAVSNTQSEAETIEATSTDSVAKAAPEEKKTTPNTITVRTDRLFGDSLPADLTNQLPETIEIPVEVLFDRSVPAE